MTVSVETITALIIGIIATARFTRLFIDDEFPPVMWIKEKFVMAVPLKWGMLVDCGFCFATWPGLINLVWAWQSDLHWTWWFANLWFAGIYLAAMLHARDVPSS